MGPILALSIIILHVTSHSCRSVPVARTSSSEENTEELDQSESESEDLPKSNRNIADLLLPLLEQASLENESERNILEVLPYDNFDEHPKRRKKNWNDRKKQLVEISPLRNKKHIKERNPPLAIILAASNISELKSNKNLKRLREQLEQRKLHEAKKRTEESNNHDSDQSKTEDYDKSSEQSDEENSSSSADVNVKKASNEKADNEDTLENNNLDKESLYQGDLNHHFTDSFQSGDFTISKDYKTKVEEEIDDYDTVTDEIDTKLDNYYALIEELQHDDGKSDETKNDSSNDSLGRSEDKSLNDDAVTKSKSTETSADSEETTKKSVHVEHKSELLKENDADVVIFEAENVPKEKEAYLIEYNEPSSEINSLNTINDESDTTNKENDKESNVQDSVEKSAVTDLFNKFYHDDTSEKFISHKLIEIINSSEDEKSAGKCLNSRRADNSSEEKHKHQPHKNYTLSFLFNK